MILVFGGTTEGRKAAEVLEEAGQPFYYSTKTDEQLLTLHHGRRLSGAMTAEAMRSFCRQQHVRLLVDAAHPFAARLHDTIAAVAAAMAVPVVRYERIYPERDDSLEWIDDYDELSALLPPHTSLLATTGVQSISRLKPLEAQGVKVSYRILNRASSIQSAHQQGATDDQLCYYDDSAAIDTDADAILLKESGLSGGFAEKVAAAKAKGMRAIVLRRPTLYAAGHDSQLQVHTVNGPHGLRRAVEALLPAFFPLHSGLTTGTCATAAAVAATCRLLGPTRHSSLPTEVPVVLPNGETIMVAVGYGDGYAYCIKEAGDDPDVTNGIEVRATVEQVSSTSCEPDNWIVIRGGEGVGRFTLPGFDYPPGEAAINKGPREMIRHNLALVTPSFSLRPPIHSLSPLSSSLVVTISVPQGEEIARRTFNPRLGIEGGISIIGVSGIVKPYSEEAFIDSIRKCLTVAQASGADRVVINSGGKSERFVRARYPELPQQAFVQYGNYIGRTLRMAHELGIRHVVLGMMLGKAVKLAEGHLDTHSRVATMNRQFVCQMLREAAIDCDISDLTLARELWQRLSAAEAQAFCRVVIRHSMAHCRPLLPTAQLDILIIGEGGEIIS